MKTVKSRARSYLQRSESSSLSLRGSQPRFSAARTSSSSFSFRFRAFNSGAKAFSVGEQQRLLNVSNRSMRPNSDCSDIGQRHESSSSSAM
jgi:hypothetical protein